MNHELHPERADSMPLVLVVEDEPLILMLYEDAIEHAGGRARTAMSVQEGLDAVSLEVDVAILDIRLGDEKVFPVAYKLLEAGIPFLFCSGTGGDMPQGVFSQIRLISKPVRAEVVVADAMSLARRNAACHG